MSETYGATVFDLYQEKIIMVVLCYTITIPVTTHREWEEGEGANSEYM